MGVKDTDMNKTPSKTQNALASSKAIRGIEREAHFKVGGTLAAWRGRHTCTPNGKAKANKNACRASASW